MGDAASAFVRASNGAANAVSRGQTLLEAAVSIEDANEACATSHDRLKEFCVYDLMASGDLDLAEDRFYN